MAGAGYKSWVDGDILTANDVNTYLMQQTVMRFADTSARTTALPTPSEGMVTYLVNTDAIEYYDGAAWQPILDQDVIQAKGDLIVGTADDTVARLAVGTNSQFLIADSSQTTGLKWSTAGVFTDFSPSCTWSTYGSFDFVRYAEVNGIVFVKFQFTLTGTPSGTFEFDQPIVEDSGTATVGSAGSAQLIDADGTNVPSFCFMTGTVIRVAVGTGGTVNSTTPFTWASGDSIRGLMIYEAD